MRVQRQLTVKDDFKDSRAVLTTVTALCSISSRFWALLVKLKYMKSRRAMHLQDAYSEIEKKIIERSKI